ncbi:hypothetical protein LAZ67_5002896, partial [Cordylochernes scorpioides]
ILSKLVLQVRKRQQRVLFTLGGMKLDHEPIDITEAGKEEEREFMREQCLKHNKNPLPPQIFNDDEYCGDYYDFELANDDDRLLPFLKLQAENGTKEGPQKSMMYTIYLLLFLMKDTYYTKEQNLVFGVVKRNL